MTPPTPHPGGDGGDAGRDLRRAVADTDGLEAEFDDHGPNAEVVDPATGTVRLCAHRCATCIFHPCNVMGLEPGMVAEAWRTEGHIPCHESLGSAAPAICRGYADGPDHGHSLALRLARALGTWVEVTPP
jgi:hypothetical protein